MSFAWEIPRAEEPGGLQSKWLGMTEHAYTYMGIAIVGEALLFFIYEVGVMIVMATP